MAYKLDATKSQTLQISNDAFWYLYQEDEMIDETNMDEAKEIMQMFPFGFIIKDDYAILEDEPDLVECTFIPYVEENNIQWDGENRCFNKKGLDPHVLLFKVLSPNKCYIRWMNEQDGKILREGEYSIAYYNKHPWCEIPSSLGTNSMFPLFGPRIRYFTQNKL